MVRINNDPCQTKYGAEFSMFIKQELVHYFFMYLLCIKVSNTGNESVSPNPFGWLMLKSCYYKNLNLVLGKGGVGGGGR